VTEDYSCNTYYYENSRICCTFVAMMLLFGAFAVAAPAQAACSPNGIENSNGNCLVSYRNQDQYSYAYQYRFENRYYDSYDRSLRSDDQAA
jgi:hypothetical protein